MNCRVHLTVDVEVWPLHGGGWPRVPLDANYDCHREIRAFLWGDCAAGAYGLPYHLQVLARHRLRATYFVDPMFSFALGIEPLRDIVALIQGHGQRVELHLHPEWLTDPRCPQFAPFAGPMIGTYSEDVQYRLICASRDRLQEAGAHAPMAFRAGGWGAASSTLRALERAGIFVDASLNANSATSLPEIVDRERLQRPVRLGSVVEVPLTRFADGMTPSDRPLSCVGVSFAETRYVLDERINAESPCAVVVLHSNEFVDTDRLWRKRPLKPRRWVAGRYERLCRFLGRNAQRFPTAFIHDHADPVPASDAVESMVRTGLLRTQLRMAGQLVSRWY